VGAGLPLIVAAAVPAERIIVAVAAGSLVLLAALGTLAARVGGASRARGALRVLFWGALAMAITALVGRVFGMAV
jgi:VIT1/CCC1 family predicted Fe2+/Mn2+ transporter